MEGNAKVAEMYLRISKEINLALNCIKDDFFSNQQIVEKAEKILLEIGQANEIDTQFPTNKKDYIKAQEGINNGQENYTNEELSLWE